MQIDSPFLLISREARKIPLPYLLSSSHSCRYRTSIVGASNIIEFSAYKFTKEYSITLHVYQTNNDNSIALHHHGDGYHEWVV